MKHFFRLNLLCSHYKLLLLTCNVAPYYISALVCLDVCGARMVNFVMYVLQGSDYWSWVVGRGYQVVGRGSWVVGRGYQL